MISLVVLCCSCSMRIYLSVIARFSWTLAQVPGFSTLFFNFFSHSSRPFCTHLKWQKLTSCLFSLYFFLYLPGFPHFLSADLAIIFTSVLSTQEWCSVLPPPDNCVTRSFHFRLFARIHRTISSLCQSGAWVVLCPVHTSWCSRSRSDFPKPKFLLFRVQYHPTRSHSTLSYVPYIP